MTPASHVLTFRGGVYIIKDWSKPLQDQVKDLRSSKWTRYYLVQQKSDVNTPINSSEILGGSIEELQSVLTDV